MWKTRDVGLFLEKKQGLREENCQVTVMRGQEIIPGEPWLFWLSGWSKACVLKVLGFNSGQGHITSVTGSIPRPGQGM